MEHLSVSFSPSFTISACVLMRKQTVCLTHLLICVCDTYQLHGSVVRLQPCPRGSSLNISTGMQIQWLVLPASFLCFSLSLCFSPSFEKVGKFVLQCQRELKYVLLPIPVCSLHLFLKVSLDFCSFHSQNTRRDRSGGKLCPATHSPAAAWTSATGTRSHVMRARSLCPRTGRWPIRRRAWSTLQSKSLLTSRTFAWIYGPVSPSDFRVGHFGLFI